MIERELGVAQFCSRPDDLALRCSKIATSALFLKQFLCVMWILELHFMLYAIFLKSYKDCDCGI